MAFAVEGLEQAIFSTGRRASSKLLDLIYKFICELRQSRGKGIQAVWHHPSCFRFPATVQTIQDCSPLQTIEESNRVVINALIQKSIETREEKKKRKQEKIDDDADVGEGKPKKKRKTSRAKKAAKPTST